MYKGLIHAERHREYLFVMPRDSEINKIAKHSAAWLVADCQGIISLRRTGSFFEMKELEEVAGFRSRTIDRNEAGRQSRGIRPADLIGQVAMAAVAESLGSFRTSGLDRGVESAADLEDGERLIDVTGLDEIFFDKPQVSVISLRNGKVVLSHTVGWLLHAEKMEHFDRIPGWTGQGI